MVLDGINTYWSRRYSNTDGTLVNNENWEIIVNAEQNKKGVSSPKIIFFTNSTETNFIRSQNWELSRKLFYKNGYLKYDDWIYLDDGYASLAFPETSAHEIGHEILLAYGGQLYSKKHKDTSTIMQDVKRHQQRWLPQIRRN